MNKPSISIILPIRNEANFISNTLDSIIDQDYPLDSLEIIIANGKSNDGTGEILLNYQNKYQNIKLVDNPERIVPTGFNRALNEAKGDIIIRVDGHTIIAADYIYNCVKLLDKKGTWNVGGQMKAKGAGFFDKIVSVATSSRFGIGNAQFHYSDKSNWVDTVYMGAWKREVFIKIGGFDEELVRNQDDEFNFRLIQNGGKIWFDPSINSVYYPRNNLKKLFKQYFQYGFYKVRVMQKRRSFVSWRHLVPGAFVFAILISILTSPISHLSFYLIFGSYLTANFIATLIESVKSFNPSAPKSITSFTLLPIIYFTLHFSYGFGFLLGLIKFWNKWIDREVKDFHFDREQFVKNTKGLSDSENPN